MAKLVRAWAGDQARGCLLQLVVFPLVIAAFALPLVAVALVPLPHGAKRDFLTIAALGTSMALIFGGTALFIRWIARRRERRLDAAFGPLGLTGHTYSMAGRRFDGTVAGRSVEAFFVRGPSVHLHVAANLRTRFSIGEASRIGSALARAVGTQLVPAGPGLEHLAASAADPAWGALFLAQPRVRQVLAGMFADVGPTEMPVVSGYPGGLVLIWHRVPEARVTPERTSAWLAGLLELAAIAEQLPAPAAALEPGRFDGPAVLRRFGFGSPRVLIAMMGMMVLFGLGVTGLGLVLFVQQVNRFR